MKKLCALIALVCLAAAPAAFAADGYDPKEAARSHLTEIYGYTAEEADGFVFEEGEGVLTFYAKDAPQWAYSLYHQEGETVNAVSPFHTSFEGYPGENAVREVVRAVRRQGFFEGWAASGRKALADLLAFNSIRPTEKLAALMDSDAPDGAQLVDELFRCFYGDETLWSAPVRQWRDDTLAALGLPVPAGWAAAPDGIERIPLARSASDKAVMTRFRGQTPDELQAVFDRAPQLEGWRCMAGAVVEFNREQQQPEDGLDWSANDRGLAAFEREGSRRLAALRKSPEGVWHVFPIGDNALYGPPYRVTIDCDIQRLAFSLRFDRDGQAAVFEVHPQHVAYDGQPVGERCAVSAYSFTDRGENTSIDMRLTGSDLWQVTEIRGNARTSRTLPIPYPLYLGLVDIAAFPKSLKEIAGIEDIALPEGCAVTSEVHLRQATSSRSRDLGMLQRGAIIRVLGMEPGDPYDWVHARVGDLEGYVSSLYTSVSEEPAETAHSLLTAHPLLLAQTLRETALKKDTGWFSGTAQKLPKGTRMHVMMERGRWLYVVIPRRQLHWRMDVDGAYGFIPKDAVRIAPLPIQLDWLNDETSPNP